MSTRKIGTCSQYPHKNRCTDGQPWASHQKDTQDMSQNDCDTTDESTRLAFLWGNLRGNTISCLGFTGPALAPQSHILGWPWGRASSMCWASYPQGRDPPDGAGRQDPGLLLPVSLGRTSACRREHHFPDQGSQPPLSPPTGIRIAPSLLQQAPRGRGNPLPVAAPQG